MTAVEEVFEKSDVLLDRYRSILASELRRTMTSIASVSELRLADFHIVVDGPSALKAVNDGQTRLPFVM